MQKPVTAFTELLDDVSQSASAGDNTLGDIDTQIRYQDLPVYLDALETHLQMQSISRDDCVAFECQNTTAALLVLLALFYRGQHLLLLPAQGNPLKEPGFKPDIPAFCKLHLTLSAGTPTPADIASLLNIYQHAQFSSEAFSRINTAGERLLLLRTSGSMGDAKIVHFSHRKLLGNAANCTERFGLLAASRVTIAVPVFHMYGLGAGFIPALLAGAGINVQANTNILRFMENDRSFKPDIVYLNPSLATMLLKGRRSKQPYTRTITAGAALPEQLYRDYQARFGPFTNLYGSTELGAAATTVDYLTGDQPNYLLPMPGVEMQIETGSQAVRCSHPYGFEGYLNSQGEALSITANPYNTGDTARFLDDGRIELLGRQSDSTNRSGFLVQFADIENALLKTGAVEQAIVLCGPQETVRGQKLYAFCIAKKTTDTTPASAPVTPDSIRQACFGQLPRYAVPDEIILQQAFPLSPSGKINRRLLQQYVSE